MLISGYSVFLILFQAQPIFLASESFTHSTRIRNTHQATTQHSIALYLKYLQSNDILLRRFAGKHLAAFETPEAIQALIEALEDTDEQLHFYVRESLKRLEKNSSSFLIQALKHPHKRIREGAARLLGDMKVDAAIIELRNLLSNDKDTKVRATAAYALGNIKDPDSTNILIHALKDTHWEVRAQSSKALGNIAQANSVKYLLQVLHEQNSYVRMHTATALGKIRHDAAVPELIKCLSDSNTEVRISCIWALGKIGNTDALKPLLFLAYKDPNGIIRIEARGALLRMGYTKDQINTYASDL